MYKNERTWKTAFGGFVTLICRLGVLIYFLVLFAQVIRKDQTKITNSEYQRDLFTDAPGINLTNSNFDIGMSLAYSGGNITIQEEIDLYFTIKFT